MKKFFYSHANETHNHKKGFALSLVFFESEGFCNSEMAELKKERVKELGRG